MARTRKRATVQVGLARQWDPRVSGDRWTWRLISSNGSQVLATGNYYASAKAAEAAYSKALAVMFAGIDFDRQWERATA